MKLITLIMIIGLTQVSAAVFSQKITLKENKASLEEVLKSIKQQSGYLLFYDKDDLASAGKVTISLNGATLEQALDAVIKDQPLSYKIFDKTIVVKKKDPTVIDKIKMALAIPITVSGKVTDETGQSLPGVTVRIKGNTTVTVTDAKGVFNISVPDDQAVLIFSYIGFETQELGAKYITSGSTIVMKASLNNLHEVVINKGYYTEKQELSTGDVSRITAKEIEEQPVSNVLAAMEGRVPGIVITQNTGAPGGSFTVQIRGQNSISQGNDPFYVVDGVPYPSQSLSILNGTLQGGNPLNFLNAFDIESVEVLKDADATSIYGSRASNGAILITTKKGNAGKMRVDFNINSGVGQITRDQKLLNTQQYLQMRNEAFKNDGETPTISNAPDLMLWDTTRYTNWQKLLVNNTAHYTDAQASVSGGTTNTQYIIGGGYHRETTVFPTLLPGQGADQKGSVHFNINTSSDNKKFKLTFSGSYLSDLNTVQPNDFNFRATNLSPDAPPIFNQDGSLNWAPAAPGQAGTWINPYAELLQQYKGSTSNLVSNALISYDLFPGLELKSSFGYTNTQVNEISTVPLSSYDPGYNATSGFSNFNTTNTHTWIVEPQVDYRLKLGKSTFAILIGSSFQENSTLVQTIAANGFLSDALLENMQAATSLSSTSTSAQYNYNAIYGRLNYNLEDKYILNVTARRDGSSRFGPGKQFGNFGAVGAAWIFTKENFIQQLLPFLNFGKLRVSYGTSGNDKIGDYQFLDIYANTSYPYQGSQGLYPNNLFNPNLAWEIDKKLEGGIELRFLKDRISVEANYYRNRTSNQLVLTPVSEVTGFPTVESNLPALVQNSGVEMTLNTTNIKSRNFSWISSINLTIPKNKLLSFPNLASSPYQNTLVVGQPINIIKAFHLIGVNDTTGLYQFRDHNGNATYNPAYNVDQTDLINVTPKFYGGFQNSFQYKRISIDVLFQFVKQTGENLNAFIQTPGTLSNEPAYILNRWQKSGDIKPIQQFSQDNSSNAYSQLNYYALYSNFVYSDASFIRLKNLSISYNLPETWQQKLHLQNARIFLQGQNLLTINKYSGNDPESQGIGLPPLQVWTLGLKATL